MALTEKKKPKMANIPPMAGDAKSPWDPSGGGVHVSSPPPGLNVKKIPECKARGVFDGEYCTTAAKMMPSHICFSSARRKRLRNWEEKFLERKQIKKKRKVEETLHVSCASF